MGSGLPGPSRCRIRPRRSLGRKPEARRRSTLGLTGSSRRVRAPQRGCSTTARSPSGECRPSASRRATAPLLRPVAPPCRRARSLARSGGDGGREKKWLGFGGAAPHAGFVRARIALRRPSQMNGSQRLGLNMAQAGVEIHDPGLRYVFRYLAGWSGSCFGSSGRK
jgi:hypothetical protein